MFIPVGIPARIWDLAESVNIQGLLGFTEDMTELSGGVEGLFHLMGDDFIVGVMAEIHFLCFGFRNITGIIRKNERRSEDPVWGAAKKQT